MRNVFSILAFFYSCSLLGQGNLQFNRALFLEMEINYLGSNTVNPTLSNSLGSYLYDTLILSVPVGKVVKIERIKANVKKNYTAICDGSNNLVISVADTLATGPGQSNFAVTNPSIFINGIQNSDSPTWLPTGTYTFTLKGSSEEVGNYSCGNGYFRMPVSYKGFISAIEFNIIP